MSNAQIWTIIIASIFVVLRNDGFSVVRITTNKVDKP